MTAETLPVVVIDPGHGGTARLGGSSPNNASGPNGLLEKDLTLDLATRVAALLAGSARVILTRTGDTNLSLADRAAVARDNGAAIFLSIHMNGFSDPAVDGTETWVARDASAASRALAQEVLTRLVGVTGVRNRGVRESNLGVLLTDRHLPTTEATLAEIAFLTNPDQARRLESLEYRQRLAEALADAVRARLAAPAGTFAFSTGRAPARALDTVTLNWGVAGGRITDPFYRSAQEKQQRTGRSSGRSRHLGIDVSTSQAGGGGADDPRRGLPVYAAIRRTIDIDALNSVAASGRSGQNVTEQTGLGIPGSGQATLQDAAVDVQLWGTPDNPDSYGGVIGLACHYGYTDADGAAATFTLYVEFLHLITERFLPKDRSGRIISADEWAATGKGIGFGPRMQNAARLTADELTGGAPLLVGYLGATEFPHVHIQAAYAPGRGRYTRNVRFDPTAVLLDSTTVTFNLAAAYALDAAALTPAEANEGESPDDLLQVQPGAAVAASLAAPAWMLSRPPLGAADARWAPDDVSPDYRHLHEAGESSQFTLTGTLIEQLCSCNRFDLAGGQSDRLLFGLRGCRLLTGTAFGPVTSVELSEDVPDHAAYHCVIGVLNRATGQLFVYQSSTVPNWKLMENYRQGGDRANMLPTGRYLYRIGTHRPFTAQDAAAGKQDHSIRGAFIQQGPVVVLRTLDDLMYTTSDTWDSGHVGDNIHPGFGEVDRGNPRFSSAGCQTIPGYYDRDRQDHTGIWREFRDAAGLSPDSPDTENGRPFVYVLLTGREARLAAANADPARLARLRFGSSGADVQALQQGLQRAGAYNGGMDGVAGVDTIIAYVEWQRARDNGLADAIVTPDAARQLGFDLLAGASIQTPSLALAGYGHRWGW